MPNINTFAKNLSPALYQDLKQAVETGKWKDGNALTDQQKAETLQLVLTYQSLFNETPDHFTIAKGGEIHMEKKGDLKKQFSKDIDEDIHRIKL